MSDEMTLEEVANETIVMLQTEGRMPWRAKIANMQTIESQVTVTMTLGPQLTIDINSPRQRQILRAACVAPLSRE
ncbi:MAG: hypothetical protein ACREC0_02120 [Methylocella sp.]